MATQVTAGDLISVRAWSSLSEQAAVNTYNFQVGATTGSGVTDQDIADGFDFLFASFYPTWQASSVNYNGAQVYFLTRAGGILPAPVSSVTHATTGTGNPACLPKNTCPVLKYNAVGRGPSERGRVFLPFCSIDGTTALGVPTSALNTLINNYGSILVSPTVVGTPPNTATLYFGVLHRHPKPAPPTLSSVVQAHSADKFGQMHKRGDYGRANQSPI